MADSFVKKTSGFFVALFIGLIVVSFIFTGSEFTRGRPDTVLSVNGHGVKIREFQNEYERILSYYRNIFGGGDLSAKQREEMNIGQRALDNLIQRKLIFDLASALSFYPGPEEIKESIKKMPSFNIGRYKADLAAQGLTPSEFEGMVAEDIAVQKMLSFLSQYPLSSHYTDSVLKFKKQKIKADLISLKKSGLYRLIPVTENEIKEFLSDEANARRTASLFNDRKDSLSQREAVKARHILFSTQGKKEDEVLKRINDLRERLTRKNFAEMADRYTEDPSGKGSGGSLGEFERGRMVKEFEETAFAMERGEISEPVKTLFGYHIILVEDIKEAREALLGEHREELARELIQKTRPDKEKALLESLKGEVEAALKRKSRRRLEQEIERLRDKYGLTVDLGAEINRYDGTVGSIDLNFDQTASLFRQEVLGEVTSFEDPVTLVMVKASQAQVSEKETAGEEKKTMALSLSNKLRTAVLSHVEENASIKRNPRAVIPR